MGILFSSREGGGDILFSSYLHGGILHSNNSVKAMVSGHLHYDYTSFKVSYTVILTELKLSRLCE